MSFSGLLIWKVFAQILFYFLTHFCCKQSCSLPCTCRRALNALYVLHSSIFLAVQIQVKVYWNDQREWEETENTGVIDSILATPYLLRWRLRWTLSLSLTNCSRDRDVLPTPGPSPPPPAPGQKSFHEKETGCRGIASGKHTSSEATAKRKERSLSQASRGTVGCILNSVL